MFSILIRYKKSHREVLLSAKSVEFIPPGGPREDEGGIHQPGLLVNNGIDGESGYHLAMTPENDPDWRDVFVMNPQGQTVARYVL